MEPKTPVETPRLPVPVSIVLWAAKLLVAGILARAAVMKLTGDPWAVETFETLDWEPFGRYLIGGLEILTAILILIPPSAVFGAFLGLGIMLGAIIGHLTKLPLDGIQYALFVAICCVLVLAILRREAEFIRNLWDW